MLELNLETNHETGERQLVVLAANFVDKVVLMTFTDGGILTEPGAKEGMKRLGLDPQGLRFDKSGAVKVEVNE